MAFQAMAGRALFLGGGLVGNIIGGALSGAGSAIGGIAEGAGRAVQGVGSAIGGALQGALTPAPKVVVNNVGMVGAAAKKKVTGTGTIPSPKKAATPNVNANMPTEKLLNVAVKYLVSIDKTLQDQIKFERLAYQQQVQAEREAAIEASPKGPGIFSRLGEKFGALKEYGSEVAGRASLLTKALIAGLGLAGLATLGISQLDTTELDRLKANWEAFKEKFGWLGEIASLAANSTSVLGFVIGGWKGAIIGTVVNWLSEKITGQSFASFLFGGDPLATDATSTAAGGGMSGGAGDTLLTGAAVGYGAYRGVKTYRDVRARMTTMAQQRAAPRAAPSLKGSGFRDPKTGRAAARAAVTSGGGWLSGPKGQRFVAFLSRRFGQSYVAKKIMPLLARVMVGLAVTATGVGAIPGILWTLLNVGLGLYTVYELLDAWWDFQDEEESREDAEAINSNPPKATDAMPAAGGGLGVAPGIVAPMNSSAAGQDATPLPAAATGSIDAILDKTPQQLTDAELRQLVERQGRIENPSGSLNNPGGLPVSSARTTPYANNVIGDVGANGAPSVRIAKFDTPENGIRAAMWLWRNGSRYRGKSVRDGLGAWSTGNDGRNPNYERMLGSARPGWTGNPNIQPGFGDAPGSLSSMAGSLVDMGQGVIKGIGSIISTGMGDYTTRSIAPTAASMNKPAEISKISSSIQNQIDLGKDKSKSNTPGVAEMVAASNRSIQNASPDGKLAAIDPNWPGSDGRVEAYLQYYKLAA